MPREITIPDDETMGFTDEALNDFQDSLENYKNEFLREIGRVEKEQNFSGSNPQVTSSIVRIAESAFSNSKSYKRKSKIRAVLKISSIILLFVCGLLSKESFLSDFGNIVLFLIVCAITIGVTIFAHLEEFS